jgi:inner membrane protein
LIPLGFIRSLISERSFLQMDVQEEIVDSWGGENLMAGPYLIRPYREQVTYFDEAKKGYQTREVEKNLILLPEAVTLNLDNLTELRSRGIYSVPVFISQADLSGHFDLTQTSTALEGKAPLWEEVQIGYAMPRMKALSSLSEVSAGGQTLEFSPGTGETALLDQHITAPWRDLTGSEKTLPFKFGLEIKGGRSMHFIPLAKETTVTLKTDWTSPSFEGAYLPTRRELTDQGTTALWKINYLSRSFPQIWTAGEMDSYRIHQSSFGLTMMEPVTAYTKNSRTAKYGLLFLIIPFSVFFLFEVIARRRIHPIQYLMAGLGNVVFYLLLLSLSEHLGFNTAYLLSAAGVIALVTLYARSILGRGSRGWIMAPILAGCYAYLFVVLQSEDYALLLGSLGLFLLVGAVMFLTRKIDWYGKQE